MAVCIMKQIVIADALLEIDKVRKICIEKSVPDSKWQNLLLFTSRYIHDTVSTIRENMTFSPLCLRVLFSYFFFFDRKLNLELT